MVPCEHWGLSGLQSITDGSLPGVVQRKNSPIVEQCEGCEYAGCICIVVVVVAVPKARAITAKVIVMANFCINNQYYTSYIFISLAFFK
jgi:hypothetical protein